MVATFNVVITFSSDTDHTEGNIRRCLHKQEFVYNSFSCWISELSLLTVFVTNIETNDRQECLLMLPMNAVPIDLMYVYII